ncbi:hypothetical protein [Oceaniferula spumae]
MKTILKTVIVTTLITVAHAQGPRPTDIGASQQQMGSPGVMWYATWDTALAEAKRSQRPILFMAAAAQCDGISGVF